MRTLIVLAIILVGCYAEECRDVGGCHHVTCASGWHMACRDHECTCLSGPLPGPAGGTNCTTQSDCHCDRDQPHCVDGHCMCGFRPGGGK